MRGIFFPRVFNLSKFCSHWNDWEVFLQWEQDWKSHKALSKSTPNVLNWERAYTIIMSQNGWRIELYWICADGLLRHLLELWLFPFFFFFFPMAYVPKHPTTQKSAVCSESLICLYAKVSNRQSHYFCFVLWRNAHLYTKDCTKAFILGRQKGECTVCFNLGEEIVYFFFSLFFFCLWPLGLERRHQLKMDAALWHSSWS